MKDLKEIKPYQHQVQYYETDQMGIAHHSNYIRWFEEARSYILTEIGMGYEKMEEIGIISPVLSVSAKCRYGRRKCRYVCSRHGFPTSCPALSHVGMVGEIC